MQIQFKLQRNAEDTLVKGVQDSETTPCTTQEEHIQEGEDQQCAASCSPMDNVPDRLISSLASFLQGKPTLCTHKCCRIASAAISPLSVCTSSTQKRQCTHCSQCVGYLFMGAEKLETCRQCNSASTALSGARWSSAM
eukprot:1193388-Amphidinium_carterae.1